MGFRTGDTNKKWSNSDMALQAKRSQAFVDPRQAHLLELTIHLATGSHTYQTYQLQRQMIMHGSFLHAVECETCSQGAE